MEISPASAPPVSYRIDRDDRLAGHLQPAGGKLAVTHRSMGIADLYPFVLAPPVIVKLSFIHDRIHAASPRRTDQGRSALRAVIASLKRGVVSPG